MKGLFFLFFIFFFCDMKILKFDIKKHNLQDRKLLLVQTGLDRINERALNLKIRVEKLENTVSGLLTNIDDQKEGVMVFIQKAIEHERQLLNLKKKIAQERKVDEIVEELKMKALKKELEGRK